MSTPDLTAAQFVAIGTAILNSVLAFGVDLSVRQQQVLLADIALVGALVFGDAVIRHGRSRVMAASARTPARKSTST